MENKLNMRMAASAFKEGDYQSALKYYKDAGKLLGNDVVKLNILLCEKRLSGDMSSFKTLEELSSNFVCVDRYKLIDENSELKRKLNESQLNIDERFHELAILTRMLEEKDRQLDHFKEKK